MFTALTVLVGTSLFQISAGEIAILTAGSVLGHLLRKKKK